MTANIQQSYQPVSSKQQSNLVSLQQLEQQLQASQTSVHAPMNTGNVHVVDQTMMGASSKQIPGTHSRYDSSDTRQRNAALISEELNQIKRGGQDQHNMEIVLSNVKKLNQQNELQYQHDIKNNVQQNSHDIQQAYKHHKNQILQLKNEIAALKRKQPGETLRNNEDIAMDLVRRRNSQQQQIQTNPASTTSTVQQRMVAPHQIATSELLAESQSSSL